MKKRKQGARRGDAPEPARPGALPHWAITGVFVASATLGAVTPTFAQVPSAPAQGAQTALRQFSVPAGPMQPALARFSQLTGITVQDPGDLGAAATTRGVSGEYTSETALRHLLAGTGVTYRFVNARTVRLERGEAPDPVDPVELAGVTVTGIRQQVSSPKYTEPLRDVPQSITVVPQAVIEKQGVSSLRDVVRNVPGLTVNAGEGGVTPGDNFSIRGFSARSDLFVNGVRDVAGYSREVFNVEQVEVTKGPGSAYVGRGSTGGAVNLVTKTPGPERAYTATGALGNGDFGRVTADVNQPVSASGLPGAAVRLNASWQNAGVVGLDEVRNASLGVAPSLALGLGTPTRLTVDASHVTQDNIPTYGLQSNDTDGPPEGIDTHRYFGLRGLDREDVESNQANVRVEHDFGSSLTLRNQLSWVSTEVERVVTIASTTGSRSARSHVTDDENLTNATTLVANFATGPVSHGVSAGVEVSREKGSFGGFTVTGPLPQVDLANPNPADSFTGTLSRRKPTRSVEATSVGAYAFETLTVNRHLELTGGLRYDRFSPEYTDSLGAVQGTPTDTDALSWRAGAVVKPTEEGSVYAAYGTSFNPTGELLAGDSRGATGVEPERNESYEVGTKWDLFRQRLSATVALFRTRKTNARITNPDDPQGPPILAGKQVSEGAEVGLTGTPVRGLNVMASYTFLESEIEAGPETSVGNPLPNTPKHAATVWTTYQLPRGFEVGGGLRFVDERWMNARSKVPAYTAYDAEAGYEVNDNLSLRLNLINLTDETYYDTGRFWVPAAGRSLRLFATVRY